MIPQNIKKQIKQVTNLKVVNTDKIEYYFDSSTDILYVPIAEYDFHSIFDNCYSLEEIELCIDNKIKTVEGMFRNCYELKEIIFTKGLNLKNVESLYEMFCDCKSLEEIDLSNMITSRKLSSIVAIFYNCAALKKVNFGDNFHTENIMNSVFAFSNCTSLENIYWKYGQQFNKVKFINGMFNCCIKLKQIDLRGINFNEIETLSGVFHGTSSDLKVLVNTTFREDLL